MAKDVQVTSLANAGDHLVVTSLVGPEVGESGAQQHFWGIALGEGFITSTYGQGGPEDDEYQVIANTSQPSIEHTDSIHLVYEPGLTIRGLTARDSIKLHLVGFTEGVQRLGENSWRVETVGFVVEIMYSQRELRARWRKK